MASQGGTRPQGGRWALSRVKSALSAATWAWRAAQAPSSCRFSTWWWPAPGRMQEESPLPVQAVLSTRLLTSFPRGKQRRTKPWAGRGCASSPLPLLTGGRPSSSCSHRHWRFIWEMQRWNLLKCGSPFCPRTAVVLRSSSLLLEHPSS